MAKDLALGEKATGRGAAGKELEHPRKHPGAGSTRRGQDHGNSRGRNDRIKNQEAKSGERSAPLAHRKVPLLLLAGTSDL